MTAICPSSGPSQKRPLVSDAFLITAGVAADLIAKAGGVGHGILASALGVFAWNAASSCLTDPPGFAVFTLQESIALNLLQIDSPDFASGLVKLKGDVETALWYVNCECVSAPQPAQPVFPALPAGTPTVPAIANGTCSDLVWQGTPVAENYPPFNTQGDISQQVLPFPGTAILSPRLGAPAQNIPVYPMPVPPPTSARTVLNLSAGGETIEVGFWFGNATCVGTDGNLSIFNNPQSVTHVDSGVRTLQTTINCGAGPLPVTHYGIEIVWAQPLGGVSVPSTLEVQLFGCNANGPQCCQPPAQSMADYSGVLNQIFSLATLLQRQLVPIAYAAGTTHAGLTGNGQFAVQGILGLAVSLTTVPTSLGSEAGDPVRLFDAGFVNTGTADGFSENMRITSNPWITFPRDMSAATLVSYTLHPGVVATITELKREA